jgi:vacuolar-type H+-ATPase subunit E/Vma4
MDEAQKIYTEPAPAPENPVQQFNAPGPDEPRSNPGGTTRATAGDTANKAGETANQAGEQAQEMATDAGERVKEKAKEAGDKVREQGRTFLNEQKEHVGSEIQAYSEAARRAAERLENESDTNLSGYVSSAADRLDRLATHVRERDLGELVDDVEEMARRRPEVFYGGMFVAGLVTARFLKASKEKRARERSRFDDGGSYERAADGMCGPAERSFKVSPETIPPQGETKQMMGGGNI